MATETSTATGTVATPAQVGAATQFTGRDATNDCKLPYLFHGAGAFIGANTQRERAKRAARHDAKMAGRRGYK